MKPDTFTPWVKPVDRPTVRFTPPRVSSVEIGSSVKGNKIMLYQFGTSGPSTLIFGAIHGDEPTSGHVARQLLELLRSDASLYRYRQVSIVTVANPDGLSKRTRANANGVDCNRNFPSRNWKRTARNSATYGGATPASEPETRAIIRAVERLAKCDRIVSIHSIRNSKQCNNFDGPGKKLAELMTASNGYPPKGSIGYPTPGSFGTWAGVEKKIPTITLELPRSASPQQAWNNNRKALLAVIQHPQLAK